MSNGHTLVPRPQRVPSCLSWLAPPFSRPAAAAPSGEQSESIFDIVVYGGTSAGVSAAIQTARMGSSVVLVAPDVIPGGLSSGGLDWTDTGNKSVIGGIAREFYHRVW